MQHKTEKDPYRKTRIAYIGEAGFEYFISLFVTTTFLVYILDAFGVSAAWKGVLANIATFSCAAQLFTLFLAGRRVKKIVTIGHLINQLCFVFLYLLPLPFLSGVPAGVRTGLFLAFLLLGHFLNNAINASKINWLMRAVPDGRRGIFTAVKESVSLLGGILLSLGLGALVDFYRARADAGDNAAMPTYYLLCAIALLFLTLLHTMTLLVSREDPPAGEHLSPAAALREAFRNRNLLKVIGVGALWSAASSLSFGHLTAYLQAELGFATQILTVTVFTVVASLCRMVFSPLLGKLADRISFARCMALCFGVAGVAFLLAAFVTPQSRYLYVGFLCLYYIAMAGINSGTINLIFDYVPPIDRGVALGLGNTCSGIAAFVASLLGGALVSAFPPVTLPGDGLRGGVPLFGGYVYVQQLLSVLTVLCILLLLVYLRFVIFPLQRADRPEE